MSLRLPGIAAIAVLLASLSLSSVLQGNGWLGAGLFAIIVVVGAGFASRLPGLQPAAVATAAALIAVVPLLFWPGWPALVAGLAIVALTAASATGAGPLRGLAVLVLYVAALLIYLNIWFAGSMSYAHLIPSHASLHQLGAMVQQAFQEFRFAPPVADTRAVSLVGAGGIGLVAIMVDVVAVRLRRPAAAGLPLLVLFSVPVASDLKTFGAWQAITFAAGMAGFLMLLSTAGRERLRMWGRLVTFRYVQRTDEAASGPDTRELAASGRRIGLAAVCLAVIVPLIVPTLAKQDIFGANGGGAGHSGGGGSGSGLDPMLNVQRSLRTKKPLPVLTYTTTSTAPADQYFQVFVLNYNGSQDNWLPMTGSQRQVQLGQPLPYHPAPSTAVTTVSTSVTLAPGQSVLDEATYLPVPYAPIKLSVAAVTGGWVEKRESLMLANTSALQSGLQYSVTSSEADPSAASIEGSSQTVPQSIINQYGNYNGPNQNQLKTLVSQHTVHAQTPLQAALDLQNWLLSSKFTYSTKPRLPASHWLWAFLNTSRRGYCQQFAWAMAVLARLAGIPSRIAVGFTAGTATTAASHGATTWRVTTADAHAWPELYFPGEGWLRFEPTPHGVGVRGQGTATVPSYASGTQPGSTGATGPGGTSSPGTPGSTGSSGGQAGAKNRFNVPGGAAGALPTAGSDTWLAIAIPVLVLALLFSPAVARRLTRRRRWLAASGDAATAAVAWRELTDDLTDYGLARAPGETPRSLARRLIREEHLDQAAAEALRRIVAAAERALYGRLAQPGAGLAADVSRVRRAVAGTVPVRQRIRAALLPASTLAAVQETLQSAGDKLRWLDTSWPALRREASWPALRRQERVPEPIRSDALTRTGS